MGWNCLSKHIVPFHTICYHYWGEKDTCARKKKRKRKRKEGEKGKENKLLNTQADINQLAISSVSRQVHVNEDDKQIGLQQRFYYKLQENRSKEIYIG